MPKKRETLASLREERAELTKQLEDTCRQLADAQAAPVEIAGKMPQLSPNTILFDAWQSGTATEAQLDELRDAVVCGGLLSEPFNENALIPADATPEDIRRVAVGFLSEMPKEVKDILVSVLTEGMTEEQKTPARAISARPTIAQMYHGWCSQQFRSLDRVPAAV